MENTTDEIVVYAREWSMDKIEILIFLWRM